MNNINDRYSTSYSLRHTKNGDDLFYIIAASVFFLFQLRYAIIIILSVSSLAASSESVIFLPAKARDYVFTGVGLCVCLSVTTITKKIVDGFVPNFMGRFLWGKGRPSSCFVTIGTIGRGIESNGQQNSVNRRLFTFHTSNSRCGKCCQVLATKTPKFRFREELYSLRVLSI